MMARYDIGNDLNAANEIELTGEIEDRWWSDDDGESVGNDWELPVVVVGVVFGRGLSHPGYGVGQAVTEVDASVAKTDPSESWGKVHLDIGHPC